MRKEKIKESTKMLIREIRGSSFRLTNAIIDLRHSTGIDMTDEILGYFYDKLKPKDKDCGVDEG